MSGNNFQHEIKAGVALVPQSVANATINGATISEPWKIGRQISFILVGGAFAASATATCAVQGLKRSDGTTWEALLNKNGVAVAFPAAKLADTAALENGSLLGTLPLRDINNATYKALRITFTAIHATATMLVGCVYVISGARRLPSGQADELFAIAHAPVA